MFKRILILSVVMILVGCGNNDPLNGFGKACYRQADIPCRHIKDEYNKRVCWDRYACKCLMKNGFSQYECPSVASEYLR